VALFEARLLLESGQVEAAAEAARKGGQTHDGSPVAAGFSELLGEALLASGDETGARGAFKVAFEASRNPDRRSVLEQRILASHERTGTLHAALSDAGGDTTVGEESALPPSILRELQKQPSAEELLRRADDAMSRGLSEKAITTYDAALAAGLSKSDAQHARLERGHALFRIRRYDESTTAFASLGRLPEARFWHARSLARSGHPRRAIRAFESIEASGDEKYAAWALYLAGTLLEDRGETARAMALYAKVAERDPSDRGVDALWRLGWSAFGTDDHARAREVFTEMSRRSEPFDALRPRYWAARAAEAAGQAKVATGELRALAAEYPFSYYGWRASERLGLAGANPISRATRRMAPGTSGVETWETHRVELLLVAGLDDFAQEELVPIARRARGVEDRKSVGRLYLMTGDYHRAQRLVVDAYRESLSRGLQPGNENLWWLSWPPAYREIVRDVFPKNAIIDPALVWAIMREESGYRPWITSSAGARGLLQIMPATGEQLARKNGLRDFDPDDLYTPKVNIQLGAAYLEELGRRFPGRLSAAIGSYNAGPRAVNGWLRGEQKNREDDAWVEDIPYKQTRSYVKRVLRSLHVYRTVYAKSALYDPTAQVAPTAEPSES
jgi:soluble lytic murein transglycosylase